LGRKPEEPRVKGGNIGRLKASGENRVRIDPGKKIQRNEIEATGKIATFKRKRGFREKMKDIGF